MNRWRRRTVVWVAGLTIASVWAPLHAEAQDILSGEVTLEARGFPRDALRPGQPDATLPLSGEPEGYLNWGDGVHPGFPFCLPRMAPLYTREPPSPRDCVRRTIVQVRRPSPQPALACSGLEVCASRGFLRHRSSLVSSLCQAGVLALAARQPAGTGSAQIRWSIAPNRRRVRWLSASSSQ